MASTYSTSLRLELIGTGEQSGTWGTTTNTNLGTLLEQAIGGYQAIAMTDANYTLSTANGAADEARNAVLRFTGTLSQARNVVCPDGIEKMYVVQNATTGGFAITFKTASGTGISVPNGSTMFLYVDGTNVLAVNGTLASQNSSSVTITGGSITGITDLAVADGGTGASDAATARSNLSAAARGANTDITSVYLNNTGLKIKDTNASHGLIIAPGSDLSADRTLTVTTGDAARTLTISGNATVSQDYSTTGNPQFATIELGAASDTTISRNSAGVIAVEGVTVPLNSTTNTHTAQQIELGHATDTTLSRSAAGVLAVEGNLVPSPASQAHGDVLYRGASGWERLAAGTSGQFLRTAGAGAAPTWAAAGGGAVILGSISTSSGSSASLGSLNLTDYKVIQLLLRGVSYSGTGTLLLGNSTSDDVAVTLAVASAANLVDGIITVDLADGVGVSAVATNASPGLWLGTNFDTALSTSTTTISVAPGFGNFDAGSIRVIGYK